jgi:hypothetical protein
VATSTPWYLGRQISVELNAHRLGGRAPWLFSYRGTGHSSTLWT